MKIVCQRQPLLEAAMNVSRAVSSKNTLAALEGILMKAHGGSLSMTGYDLELAISTDIAVDVSEEGELILPAKLFIDMIRRIPDESVSIANDEKMLTVIRGQKAEYTILGIPSAEFPELPAISDTKPMDIGQGLLKNMIDQTLFAVAVGDSKPVHTGSLFDYKEGCLNVVSVDGYRLALRREDVKLDEDVSFIVPGKSLSEVSKLLRDEEDMAQLFISRHHIIFEINGYKIVSRLLEGDFLDYKAAIPTGEQTVIRIVTRELINAIDRASLLISDNIKSPLRMSFNDGLVKISCSTALGKAYDELSCQQTGQDLEIGFNSRYMLDALKASASDEMIMVLNGPLSPMKLQPLEGESFVFLVLPVRIKAE